MNKSKFLKKSLAAVLAVLMIVAMIPLSAAAAYDAPITRFTVNGEEVASNGKALSATVKDTANVVLGAVCPEGTTLQYKEKDGTAVDFTSDNNGWTATITDLNDCKSTGENTYEIPVIASTTVEQDDQPTEVEYTLTITYSPDASSGDNEVKTVKKVSGKITENMTAYDIDNVNNKITITVPFGTTAAAPDDSCFTYADDVAAKVFTPNASGITTDGKLVVTAANGNTRQYTVVTVWESPFKSLSVEGQTADAKFNLDGTAATGQGLTIDVKMPYGTKVDEKQVVLTYELSDSFKAVQTTVGGVGSTEIVSGKTKVDITGSAGSEVIVLTVVPKSGSNGTVTVKLDIPAKNPEGLLKSIKVSGNSKTSNTIDVDKDTRTVDVEMPANWDFANASEGKAAALDMVASENAVVTVVEYDKKNTAAASTGIVPQITGVDVSGKRFTIRVKSEDGKTTNEYTINLTKAAAAENKLNNFTLKGEIDGEKIERSAVWNGETGTVTMPYAFKNSDTWGDMKVYATSSVGSKIYLSNGTTEVTNFGSDYETLWNSGTNNAVPEIDATAAFEYVVKNTENGTATYKIFIKTEAPRTQKSFISGTLVGTNDYNQITANNTYAMSAPTKIDEERDGTKTGKQVNAIKVTLPNTYSVASEADDPYFSALTLSPGATAYALVRATGGTTTVEKIKTLDPDVTGGQNVAHINMFGTSVANFFSAYDKAANTVDTKTGTIAVYVVSEKYAALAADSYTTAQWVAGLAAFDNAEVYYLYGEQAPAEKGNTMTSLASTLDTNVTASVNNSTQTINITVPDSYNDGTKKFSLNFALSKMAKAHINSKAGAELKSDLGSKDTTIADTEKFNVNAGTLRLDTTDITSGIVVVAEDGTERAYKVVVKVNDPEKGYALTGVEATCGANKGTGRISGTTVTLTMPFGTKLFPAKVKLTASKMADIEIYNGTTWDAYDPDATFDLNNDIKVQVTAEDGEHSQIYTIKTTLGERFSDVPADAWFAPYVEEAYDKGIVEGIGNGQFGPNTNISRQDFAVMTVRMLGKEDEANAMKDSPISFSDADRIADYAKGAVAYCAANKILNGYNTGKFEPTLTITREEAAKILAVAKGLEVTGTPDFADNSRISGWAQPYVAAVQNAGIFKGDEANRFNPQQKITRAETAKVMVESLKK